MLPAIDKNRVWDCIVPVPISRERLKQRGYDQSVLLAKEVSKLTGIPCRTDILEKTKHNRTQHNLSAKEREANVRGAYRAEGAARLRILLFGRYCDDRRDGCGMRKGIVPKQGGLCGLCFVRDGRLDLAKREKVM